MVWLCKESGEIRGEARHPLQRGESLRGVVSPLKECCGKPNWVHLEHSPSYTTVADFADALLPKCGCDRARSRW